MKLTVQDWEDARAAADRIAKKHNGKVSPQGLKILADGAHMKRHFREGAPL